MTGITPAVLTFNGINVDWPPTIFRPCIFLAYCTGIFLVASLSTMTRTIVTRMTAIIIRAAKAPCARVLPFTNISNSPVISDGMLERMLIIRTMEIPFPTPFCVIRSPIHISKVDPAVRAVTTIKPFRKFRSGIRPDLPKPTVIAILSIRASATVTYRVIEAIFFLPSSPSLCISSSAGMAMVRSCIMMDEVI